MLLLAVNSLSRIGWPIGLAFILSDLALNRFRSAAACSYDPAAMTHPSRLTVPDIPVLIAGLTRALWVGRDGDIEELDKAGVALRLREGVAPLLCHAPSVTRRLELPGILAFDILELFAFVRPAQFCLPTVQGVASALGLGKARGPEDQALLLLRAMTELLLRCSADADEQAATIAQRMEEAQWPWAPFVLAALSGQPKPELSKSGHGLAIWHSLPKTEEARPVSAPTHYPVQAHEARETLAGLLGQEAESRSCQAEFAAIAASAFEPRKVPGEPAFVIAEAGTGIGKTLGYLAPASLWAERNDDTVWVSTYTRNLQHQIDGELDRVYCQAAEKAVQAVVRKGRENYLCLLNFEEAVQSLPLLPAHGTALGLMARFAAVTRDGDLSGGDFPGWLVELLGRPLTLGLADRRGECIYCACPHYDRCFVERSVRKSRKARIVVANHALLITTVALGGEEAGAPRRMVFDEGHHLFDAADSAFCAQLSASAGYELRRWLLGSASGQSRSGLLGRASGQSRLRGLRRRIEDLLPDRDSFDRLIELLRIARFLPGEGWGERLAENRPHGPLETLLGLMRRQTLARQTANDSAWLYDIETDVQPLDEDIPGAAEQAKATLLQMKAPAELLMKRLRRRLEEEAEDLETNSRLRLEATIRSLERRILLPITGWIDMMTALTGLPQAEGMVDWFCVKREEGREIDVGMIRHWIDPMRPFAQFVARPAHGILVTSATLTDKSNEDAVDWSIADRHTGAAHLPIAPVRCRLPSPFNYPERTRVLIVTDVSKNDIAQRAAAYRSLFLASGGGALGVFTAIQRLRAVYAAIAAPMEQAGIALLAQHVDRLELATLIDIFRAEEDSCLLGTDAVRDGVDVPGRSLRLLVFDRVPWPRPDILHRARRIVFGKNLFDDRIARLRLKQAFGRLVRRADDRGVFVLLDRQTPSRLLSAFPPGVCIERVGLAQATAIAGQFLQKA